MNYSENIYMYIWSVATYLSEIHATSMVTCINNALVNYVTEFEVETNFNKEEG